MAPSINPFTFGETSYNSGDSVGLQCIITKGDSPIDLRWTLNESPINSGQNEIIIIKISEKTSVLNIVSITGMHRGVYKCIAKNNAGVAEHATELRVNGILYEFFKLVF